MTDRADLVHSAPWALTPPYNTYDPRLHRQSGEPADHARHRILALKVATLPEPLDGLELTDYERQVLSWIGCWETHTVAVLAALLRRARRA
ncbi:hypothetical protein [Pseudonocardia sp. WMMC193]|uniref:hypothetical protein n=1 Tax=Pseudonocardia sp. WMMC193 TaxID=2911965 RepID=UPI001F3010FF|nr:hypothetical protein [Pseudonocardia sp. WMMC193]MCF7552248.1 hypothetical protein [Pseudonocardia sp. WMMC193]